MDTLGLLIAVVVTAANVDDGRAAPEVFAQAPGRDLPRLKVVFADDKYHNHGLYAWLRLHRRPYQLEVVSRPQGETRFKPLKVRWVVERTFAWLGRYRCLSKDYEHTTESSETVVRLAAIHHMLRRLRPGHAAEPTIPVQAATPKTGGVGLQEQSLTRRRCYASCWGAIIRGCRPSRHSRIARAATASCGCSPVRAITASATFSLTVVRRRRSKLLNKLLMALCRK